MNLQPRGFEMPTDKALGETLVAVEATASTAPSARDERTTPEQGSRIGRHVVLYPLGAGGMGVVLAAYDPQLDRKIAIKLLRHRGGDLGEAQERLQREAQALAKLDHPNVVAVYDVGLHDDQLFVTMEFIAGRTLAEWMSESEGGPRPWREVLAVFLEAGRGLVVAHQAGLVHRDFKPDNVMLGDDGRVRVMDFGLALEHERQRRPMTNTGLHRPLGSHVDQTGLMTGTPAYMSHEQFLGVDLDARSDQFSFCVALYEALYGVRPFVGKTLFELMQVVEDGTITESPTSANVPAWLRRAVIKGLATHRVNRWPSMEALLEALSDDPAPRRRRWATAAIAIALFGGATWGVTTSLQAAAQQCSGAEAKLADAWDQPRRAAVEQAILATHLSYAPDTWERVAGHLDRYAAAWVAARTDACEDSRRGEQSGELLDLRMACLDERRKHLQATVDELASADAAVVENAVQTVLALPSLERCADADALRAAIPPPEDPAVAQQVAALDDRLVAIAAKQGAGRYDEALALIKAVIDEAAALEYPPLLTRARLRLGHLQALQADYEGAEATFEQVLYAAVAQRMADEAASASAGLVFVVGYQQSRHDAARRWAALAHAHAEAAGTDEARATYLNNLGNLAHSEGKYAEARELQGQALALREQALGPEHPLVASSLNNLANAADSAGDYAEARGFHERALAIYEAALGPGHPAVAGSLNNLGNAALSEGAQQQARAYFERALAIYEKALGPEHPDVATPLNNLSNIAQIEGKYAEAYAYGERALAILEGALGPGHPRVAITLVGLGNAANFEHKYAEARGFHERALTIFEETVGPEHPHIAITLISLAEVALAEGDAETARGYAERALAMCEHMLGPEHPLVALALHTLGQALIELEQPAQALPLLERALAITGDTPASERAATQFLLARALWDSPEGRGRDRARAREQAALARSGHAQAGDAAADDLRAVERWLAEHDG